MSGNQGPLGDGALSYFSLTVFLFSTEEPTEAKYQKAALKAGLVLGAYPNEECSSVSF